MLNVKETKGVLVVDFGDKDRINALISQPIKESLLKYYNTSGSKIVLDLTNIKFIDSSGFSIFLALMKEAQKSDGQFKICNIDKEVMELFKVLQLHNVFELFDTLEDCLDSFENISEE